ncbi:MAG: TonB-dependent receptor [Pseudomonadota bacterium]
MKRQTVIQQLKTGAAPVVLGLSLIASPAFAQDQAPEDVQEADDQGPGADETPIVVTGTLIKNPAIEATNPVAVISSEELELRQTNVAEEFLRQLPASVPSIGSAVNNGNGGAAFVNLRGVGSVRNLVLLDGKRFVPADSTGRVDLNSIPLAVLERTDILTGGATTTYGADAVSGVINFITRRDFAGIDASVASQITEQGDGAVFRTDITIGANFDDGRGNAVLSVGYQNADEVLQGGRDFSLFNVSSFSGNPGGSSNAVPANIIFASLTDPASICDPAITDPTMCPLVAGSANPANNGRQQVPNGFGFTNGIIAQINQAGTDIELDDPFNNGLFNPNPFNFNPFNIFQTPFERFNIFGSARYEINENVELYTQGTFTRQTVSTIIAPGGSFFNTYQLNLNNPLIPDAIAERFGAGLGLFGADFDAARNTQFGPTLANGDPNPDYVQFAAQVRRRSVEAGTRNSDFTTTLFNIVAGVRGNITDYIQYDVSGTYGESERIQRQSGFARFERLQQSLLAIPDGTGGAVCTDTTAGCLPINLFGTLGNLGSPETIGFVFDLTQQVINTSTIATVNGTITGDFDGFAIAETPIAFAAGVEYREFTATRLSDEASQTPGAVVGGGGAAPDINGSYDVLDAFGEIVIPILEGQSFAEELVLEAGVRYSDYSTAGTEWTWKAGASWTPVNGLTFRGNFQRAARAPNIGELFVPVVTGLANLQNEPCQGPTPPTGGLLEACLAQVPAGSPGAAAIAAGQVQPPAAGQINVTTGGNPNLGVEEAETYTFGVIIQPEEIPGLTVTVDYFNIAVDGAISTPAVGDVISACFDNPSAANPNCGIDRISRNPTTGGIDGAPDETPGLFLNASNLGRIRTDGIDLTIFYGTDLTDNIGLNVSFNGTWTNENRFQATPASLDRDCVGFFSVNCGSPQSEFAWNQRTSLIFDDELTVSLLWRFLSGLEQEPDDIANQGSAFIGNSPIFGDVDFTQIPDESYFDLSLQWDATENLLFTFTVQNLFDNQPAIVGSNIGTTAFNSGNIFPSSYDPLGRRYAATARLRF